MPRRSKGPRLWFRKDRDAWFVLDGGRQHGTGLGAGATTEEKDGALKAYLGTKHVAAVTTGTRDPSQIPIDDVFLVYVRDVVPRHARPAETATRIGALRTFWSGRTLDFVTGQTCRQYAKGRGTSGRRELEDLRSAINHHRREGLHDKIVSVVLPPRRPARDVWMTKPEAARLILTTWRYRDAQGGPMAGRRTRKHVARFMIVARYMGSRAADGRIRRAGAPGGRRDGITLRLSPN